MLNLITRHLDPSGMKLPIYKSLKDELCAFTGAIISQGVKLNDLIKDTFTDQAYIRYNSEYASVELAMLIEATVPSEKGFNCLRNYSFLATADSLKLLKREEVLHHILYPPKEPFYFGVTYSNKKHIAFKCRLNQTTNNFIITTDKGNIRIDKAVFLLVFLIAQAWYTVPENEKSKASPKTYFTKAQILGENEPSFAQIESYGLQKFEFENEVLSEFRGGSLLELVVWGLNKKINWQ